MTPARDAALAIKLNAWAIDMLHPLANHLDRLHRNTLQRVANEMMELRATLALESSHPDHSSCPSSNPPAAEVQGERHTGATGSEGPTVSGARSMAEHPDREAEVSDAEVKAYDDTWNKIMRDPGEITCGQLKRRCLAAALSVRRKS